MIISRIPWPSARVAELEDWVSSGAGIYREYLQNCRDALLMEHGRRSIDPSFIGRGESSDMLEKARKFQVAIEVFGDLAAGQYPPESVSSVAGEQ